MDPPEGSWLDGALFMEEAEFGFDQFLTSDMPYDWEGMGLDTPELTTAPSLSISPANTATVFERVDANNPATTHHPITEDDGSNRGEPGLTGSQASLGSSLPQVNHDTNTHFTPAAYGREAPSTDNSGMQYFAIAGHQTMSTEYSIPHDDLQPSLQPITINRPKCLNMLIAAFKNLKHSEGREDEVEWVQEQTEATINRWCHETLEAIITRQSSGTPLCPNLRKRTTIKTRPNYPTFIARLKAVYEVLKTEKRSCKRFQRDHGWAKKLADDPVYEKAAIINNDNGNSARAMHERKKKENDVVMLEGWKRLLAGDVLTRAEVMHFVGLAEYNTEYGRKGRQMATSSKSRRGRQAELSTSNDEFDFAEATSIAGSLAEASPYVGHNNPGQFVGQ
jgi:hypothetical protein